MKNIFTFLTLFTFSSLFAIDRFVDPNLSSGNGTTLFTNITSAVAAAVNGDRIIVASNTYNEATLTIDKSLKIIPQTAGTSINFNANIIISGFAGMKLEITGFNLGIYSFGSNGGGSSALDRAKVSIVNCTSVDINIIGDYFEANIIKNNLTGDITFLYGNVISNSCSNINLRDEILVSQNSAQKNLIINNVVTNRIWVFNNNYKFIIANNIITGIAIKMWDLNAQKNLIINNQFNTGAFVFVAVRYVPSYNIVFSSNKFIQTPYFNASGYFDYGNEAEYDTSLGTTTSAFPNTSVVGFFDWTYNGVDLPCGVPSAGSPLVLTEIIGASNDIDGGNPNHDYYDIDLTINDRGINGGPYSQLNYTPSNPNNSKAFIFDLDMPTDLFPGQNVNITAKGYHKN